LLLLCLTNLQVSQKNNNMGSSRNIKTANTIVFAYSDIGVRCLSVLLASKLINISLVVTHRDNASENVWFDSVASLAALNDIPVITPDNVNAPDIVKKIYSLKPDLIFSFYFRQLLCEDILNIPHSGALNMHGSLLPRYRGRAPVNWVVLRGETETGASLHRMVAKPDAGNLIDQQAVAILPNDTAFQVHQKVAVAAEQVLIRCIPSLVDGSAKETIMDISRGNYCGGRKPEDGRIDWSQPAAMIHNLIRAVAPPYPGAFFEVENHRIEILGSYYRELPSLGDVTRIYHNHHQLWADCIDGKRLQILAMKVDSQTCDAHQFAAMFGNELMLPD
jgi:methionyl-tRNA formyltransferase